MEGLVWRSDAELVNGVRRGEEFAFGQLFERWFDRVLSAAQDVLGDPVEAAEVATDTFHSLWHHLAQLEDPEGFGPWALETSRAFASDRLAARPVEPERERTPPLLIVPGLAELTASVAHALVSRGVPSMAGSAGPVGGTAGSVGGAGGAGGLFQPGGLLQGLTVPAGPSAPLTAGSALPAGSAGSVLPAAGSAGGAAGAGTAGGAAAPGGILSSSLGQAALVGQAVDRVVGGVTLAPAGPANPRQFEPAVPAPVGREPGPLRLLLGALVAAVVVAVGCLFWLVNRDDPADDSAVAVLAQLDDPASPTTVTPLGATTSDPDQTSSSSSTTSRATSSSASSTIATTRSSTTSSTRPSTTVATTPTTVSTTPTTVATTPTTVATTSTTVSTTPTTVSTTPTTPTTVATAPTTGRTTTTTGTTATSRITRPTTTTSTSLVTATTVPSPKIQSLTVTGATSACSLRGTSSYTVSWVASDATSASGAIASVPAQIFSGKAEGSFTFCAAPETGIALTASGPGGKVSARTTTP